MLMRVDVVDPSAYTPPYDHALSAALARAGADVRLVTSRFAYGPVPEAEGYERAEPFYAMAAAVGGRLPAGSRTRQALKLAEHVPDMLRYRRMACSADVVHFQWLTIQPLDVHLLPRRRPLVLTAHDVLPREPRPGQLRAQRRLYGRVDAVIVHSEHGRHRLVEQAGVPEHRIHVIPHGAFDHRPAHPAPLPPELAAVSGPVVLCFGLMRPYKGIDVLLEAWRGIDGAELWIVGHPRMDISDLLAQAPPNVRFVPRFVTDNEIPAYFERADVVVLPYREIDQSGVLFTALGYGSPLLLSAVGGFPEVAATGAARLVAPGDPNALHDGLVDLLLDEAARRSLADAARAAARGPYSWDTVARSTLDVYRCVA
jgi:glycosyltransferase involved in cell wall biosynthesis